MTKRSSPVPPPASPVPVPPPPAPRLVPAFDDDPLPVMAVREGEGDESALRPGHERRFWMEVAALLAIVIGFAGIAGGVTWAGIELFDWLGWGAQ